MKVEADNNRTDRSFQVGDRVLLKLQPYAQGSVAHRPCPKLTYKFFGPFEIADKIGTSAYKLKLPDTSKIHPVFHISQPKEFIPDCSPVFTTLPELSIRLVKKGNVAVFQILVQWSGLRESSAGHLGRSQCFSRKVSIGGSLETGCMFGKGYCHHLDGKEFNLTRKFHWA
jgi:hypothetical protein